MAYAQESDSDGHLAEIFRFTQDMLQASAAVMFWIDSSQRLEVARKIGLPQDMDAEYFSTFHRYDPMNPIRLIEQGQSVSFLREAELTQPDHARTMNRSFMARHGVRDEVDFVLCGENAPIAVISVLKCPLDPPFETGHFQWGALHRHLQYTLGQHPRVREAQKEAVLSRKFKLTTREIEVIKLLQIGASNAKIAHLMGIGMATVKTHVVNILDKIGVDSRLAVAAFVSRL